MGNHCRKGKRCAALITAKPDILPKLPYRDNKGRKTGRKHELQHNNYARTNYYRPEMHRCMGTEHLQAAMPMTE